MSLDYREDPEISDKKLLENWHAKVEFKTELELAKEWDYTCHDLCANCIKAWKCVQIIWKMIVRSLENRLDWIVDHMGKTDWVGFAADVWNYVLNNDPDAYYPSPEEIADNEEKNT